MRMKAMKRIRNGLALLLAALLALSCAPVALASGHIWQVGDSGEEVVWIQTRLQALGYLSTEPTGVYDERTEEAVLLFQSLNRLLATGQVDSVTWETLGKEGAVPCRASSGWVEDGLEMAMEVFDSEMSFYAGAPAIRSTATALPAAAAAAYDAVWGFNTEEYTVFSENGFQSVAVNPLSTFAADVDTSSYALLRRRILAGEAVPPTSVRVEELLNYFRYAYPQPEGAEPFGVSMTLADCPWNENTKLLQIGLQAREVPEEERPPYHLVFLIDTSGSMAGSDRLDLVKRAFLLLLEELKPTDLVSIVTYASMDKVVLEGVPAGEKTRIMEAITALEPRGGTNGTAGLLRAYDVAGHFLIPGGVNRILLATDGDLNLGLTSEGELARMVTEKKQGGVSLTCLGFGMGNYKDNKMEALADYGDGNCWYIDTIYEARKALVTEGGGTFLTVAKDVKLQVDFNPAYVKGYRLIGYEDRLMAAEDFADDSKDGGEVGSGHQVTALYELVPADSSFSFGDVTSRYATAAGQDNGEWLTLSLRAKAPEGDTSELYTWSLQGDALGEMDDNMKFAAAVAEVAMALRDSEWRGTADYASALTLLRSCGSVTGDPYREEFLYMVNLLERAAP